MCLCVCRVGEGDIYVYVLCQYKDVYFVFSVRDVCVLVCGMSVRQMSVCLCTVHVRDVYFVFSVT